jgi:hypothetical protein
MSPELADKPIDIAGFNGLWSRGTGETCPLDHLQVCQNCTFPGRDQVSIREPVTFSSANLVPTSTLISFAVVQLATEPILITLDAAGNLVDATNSRLLAATLSGVDDFIAFAIYGRVYISYKYHGKALASGNLYYYELLPTSPYYRFTFAGTSAPGSAPTAAQGSTGVVSAGVHQVAVSFQTETGYLSPPSPIGTVTSDGSHTVALSAIPIPVPANVVYTVLLMSLANQTELFFVPGGTIAAGTTTAIINVADTALLTSADYLNDILTLLPSCSAIRLYNGRLVLIGPDGQPDNVLVSNQLAPETINQDTGIVNLPVDYGVNTTNTAAIIRDVLYCMKPNGTFAVQDNGGDPSTWSVTLVDSGLGTYDTGMSLFSSSASAQDILEQVIIVHQRGLLLFNGSYLDPPLTYKIESLWQTIDYTKLYKVQIAHDPYLKRIYVIIPTTGIDSLFLMGDYTEGLAASSIKWSTWAFGWVANSAITKLTIENFAANYTSGNIWQIAFCCGDHNTYKIVPPASTAQAPLYGDLQAAPSTYAINQIIQTANVGPGFGMTLFSMLNLGVSGIGPLTITLLSKRKDVNFNPVGFNLTAYNPLFSTNAPTSAPTLAQVNAGSVTAGVHQVYVCYQMTNGFISQPSPAASITSTGSQDIELSAIPVSSNPNVSARVLLMTKAGATGLFFVPGGTIANNTATTGTINVADSSLVTSADYLIAAYGTQTTSTELYRGINFLSEAMSVKLQCNSVFSQTGYANYLNAAFQLSAISVFGKLMFKTRPVMVQQS